MTALVHDDVDVVPALRAMVPARAISWSEAHLLAERQASALLDMLHVAEPPVPQFVISSLPGIVVDWRKDWPTSGMSVKGAQNWHIVLRASEPRQRQRFTLAHEFKHILDDLVIEKLSKHLLPEERHERAERLCNYFAACLLMPRPWIEHDFGWGLQKVRPLARRYYVSQEAMTTRLSELGLTHMTSLSSPARPRVTKEVRHERRR